MSINYETWWKIIANTIALVTHNIAVSSTKEKKWKPYFNVHVWMTSNCLLNKDGDQTKAISFPPSPLAVVVVVVVYYCFGFRKSGIKVKYKSEQKWSVFQDLHRGCLHMIARVNPPGV